MKRERQEMDLKKRKTPKAIIIIAVLTAVFLLGTGGAMAFSAEVGDEYEITDAGKIVYGPGDGGYSNSKTTDLGDGMGERYSYCVQPDRDTPVSGSVTINKVIGNEETEGTWYALRKVVYYSPSYPGYEDNVKDIRGTFYTGDFSKDWGIAHLAMSYLYAGCPEDLDTYIGTKASDLGEVWTGAKKLGDEMLKRGTEWDEPLPLNFEVLISSVGSYQSMAVGHMEQPGTFMIRKRSSLETVSKGNGHYSLKGAEYKIMNERSEQVALAVINSSGKSESIQLPPGDYTVTETKAPSGYALDKTVYPVSITSEGNTTLETKDTPVTAKINLLMKKLPEGFSGDHGEGDATLKGAVYRFSYLDKNGDSVKTWHFVTDEKGKISGSEPSFAKGFKNDELYRNPDGEVVFPLGKYKVEEIEAPKGYIKDKSEMTMEVTEDGTGDVYTGAVITAESHEKIIRGGFEILKDDAQLKDTVPQGNASLKDAAFAVVNRSEAEVCFDGKMIKTGEKVLTVYTDENGKASAEGLPYGTYSVYEEALPEGYLPDETWEQTFKIRKNGETVDLTEKRIDEKVKRAGIQMIKLDGELLRSEAMGGASLEGIKMTVRNLSKNPILVRTELDNKEDRVDWDDAKQLDLLLKNGKVRLAAPGEDVGEITVRWNEEKKAYTAETLDNDLPYGVYGIRETKTNESYQRTDKAEHIIELKEDGKLYSYDNGHEEILSFSDLVYRSDVKATKIGDSTSERFSYVPFKIISVSNGETHVVVTDKNGLLFTGDRRTADEMDESEGSDGERKINPFDDLLNKETVTTADIEKRKDDIRMGVWFGTGEFGNKSEAVSGCGALPFDTYVIEEMSCEGNSGYTLQRFMFTVEEKSLNGLVDLETITNDIPEIETYAESKGEKEDTKITENAVITDTVKYKDLKPGETYLLTGRLMDRKTGEAVKNSKGEIIVSQKEFKPIMSKGKVKVEFAFDARGLEGMDTVVFERLYDASGHIVAVHEDIDDEGQTVSWEKPEKEEPPEEEPPKEEPPEKEPPKKEPPHKEPPAKTPTIKKPPKTGDVSGLDIWAGLFTASAAAWIIVKRNKKGTRL